MYKKTIVSLMILTALSSFSFAGGKAPGKFVGDSKNMEKARLTDEQKKLYENIYSKYEDKFNKIDVSLLENKQNLDKELRQEKIDWKKVENMTKTKANLRAQKELLGYQLKDELSKNDLPGSYGRMYKYNNFDRTRPNPDVKN